ncbi:MAG: xylose isomerase [Bacteroidia bacterium]|nr:xylose isomerase [Bacteroidia bacterium]
MAHQTIAPVLIGKQEYFPQVSSVSFEGHSSSNPFAYKFYDPARVIAGKSMKDHFKFAVAYWHSFCGTGADPFGSGPRPMPWLQNPDPIQKAKDKMDAAFEFMTKMGLNYYCFHDFDLVEEGSDLQVSRYRLESIADYALEKQENSGIKVLWGTANLFSHPRYMNGAASNPDFSIVAYAGAQVKNALDISIKLGAENYVFWGGREGYMSLLNTHMKQEQEQLARFFTMARDYARKKGFKGYFFIEPKPAEPSKHQYDFDAATVLGFLQKYDLLEDFKLNLEVNHATLAQHTFAHEVQVAVDSGALGSIDANRGDEQNGWDTDQFPNNHMELVEAMMIILQSDGFVGGGVNFDAKLRRNSTDLEDLFYAHIGGMDAFAKALIVADKILRESDYLKMKNERYQSFQEEKGQQFLRGELKMEDLSIYSWNQGEPEAKSGKQELYENLIAEYLYRFI